MADQQLEYHVEIRSWAFEVRELRGVEQLSKDFTLDMVFFLDHQSMRGDPNTFDPDEIIKADATVVLMRGAEEVRRIQGVVTKASLSAAVQGVPEVHVRVEPRLSLLRWRKDIRIHRNQTVPEIVRDVVQALGVKIEWRLDATYESRPYCVQYRETDYDYVNRLLEDEGIFYFFAPGDVMVLGDSPRAYQPIAGNPAVPFHAAAGANRHEDAVHEIGSRASLTTGKVALRDWNTEHPSLNMDVRANTKVDLDTEWYDYPGEYEEPGAGQRKAQLHAEAFDRLGAAMVGASTCGRFFPGATFTFLNVPVGVGVAPGTEHVLRKVTHEYEREKDDFETKFEADPADVTYRPPRDTFIPRTFNPVSAIVCTNGEDIQCDHFGRVKMHFHWDRLRPYDDDCSHWVPVIQDNTGGSSAIPRRDWEMLVHYLEGDPDRPVVLGRVYNGEDQAFEPLPETKTRSSLKSLTTPSREGKNEIMFEDLKGKQQIMVRAQKDQLIRTSRNRTEDTGSTQRCAVGNDEQVSIGNNAKWDIGADHLGRVSGNQTYKVGGNNERTVSGSDAADVGGDRQITITGNHERKIFSDDGVSCKTLEETIKGSVTEEFEGKHQRKFGMNHQLKIGGSMFETAKETKSENNTKLRKEEVGSVHFVRAGGEYQLRVTNNRTTIVGGSVLAVSQKELTLTGAEKFKSHSASVTLDGSTDITLKVGKTVVLMKDGIIRIDAPQSIAMVTDSVNNQGAAKSRQI